MGVIAKLTEEQIADELHRAEACLERLRSQKAPWESLNLAESKLRSLRRMKPTRTEWVLATVTFREQSVPATIRRACARSASLTSAR